MTPRKEILENLANAINELYGKEGYKAEVNETTNHAGNPIVQLLVNSKHFYHIDFTEMRASSGLRFRLGPSLGVWMVFIGDYSNKKRFRQKKDGTMRYDEMALAVRNNLVWEAQRQAKRKADAVNANVAETFNKKNGISGYGNFEVRSSGSTEKPFDLMFRVNGLTVDEAQRLFDAIKAIRPEVR